MPSIPLHDPTLPLGQVVVGPVDSSGVDGIGDSQPASIVTRPTTTRVWGTDFARVTMPETVDLAEEIVLSRRPEFMVTANLNYLMLCEQHPRLHEVNSHAFAVLADGQPIVARSRFSRQPSLPERVTGADLVVELAGLCARQGYRMFFLGGAPGVAEAAKLELTRRIPGFSLAGSYAPPFRSLNSAEHAEMLQRIRDVGTDILLVAFGQPKGEFWIYDHLAELQIPLSIQIGASLDFLAGAARRAPTVWQQAGCEWLYRASTDPMRLVPRYSRNALFLARQAAGELLSLPFGFLSRNGDAQSHRDASGGNAQ